MLSYRNLCAFCLVGTAAACLAGCASVPADLGREDARALATARGVTLADRSDDEARQLVDELLSAPLQPDDAVCIALIRNPRMSLAYARLGLAAADVYAAGRLSNPRLSVASLDSDEPGAADQVTFGLAQSFTDILLIKARSRLARGEFERTKLLAAGAMLELAADVEAAYYELAGAEQIALMRGAVVEATEAAAALAERFFAAGNITRLELALERTAASEARLGELDARAAVARERTRLNRLLGLPGDADYELARGLPAPPDTEEPVDAFLALAEASRLDLAAQRREVELLADSLGVTRRYRWLGALGDVEIGAVRERETDRSTIRGPTLALELPVFDQHADAVTRAEMQLAIAEAELHALEIEVGNEVRLAYEQVLNARALTREHRDVLVPLREDIVARTQEQVNFMLAGVFELLRVKALEYDAYQSYLETVRDYWVARVELQRAVAAPLSGVARAGTSHLDAEALIAPAPADMHHGHDEHGDPQ